MVDLLEKGKASLGDKCLITGGHFRIFFNDGNFEPHLNEGTIRSFKAALELFSISRSQGLSTDIGLLINDMGSACDEDGCRIDSLDFSRDKYRLPRLYLELMHGYGIDRDDIRIYWEKHIRNRAKKEFLKLLKKGDNGIKKDLKGYYMEKKNPYSRIILTRTQGRDKYGVPACSLIMGGLNFEQGKYYDRSINFYYIGSDNIDNIPNYFVIDKAQHVARLLGSSIDVVNIYFEE